MVHRICVLTALYDVELPQTLLAFGIDPSLPPSEQDGGARYWKTTLSGQNQENLEIIISTMNRAGNVEALFETTRMINKFEPEFIALVGIACGINCDLADVVVGEEVYAYQFVKNTCQGVLNRVRTLSPPKTVLYDVGMMFREPEVNSWHESFRNVQANIRDQSKLPYRRVHSPKSYRGVIASGDAVMADGNLSKLQKGYDLIRAGEMEGYGFSSGCENSRPSIPWLIVRGVSDRGDATKDNIEKPGVPSAIEEQRDFLLSPPTAEYAHNYGRPNKDEYHCIAALSAATFLYTFLKRTYTPQSIWANKLSEFDFRIVKDETDIMISDTDDARLLIGVKRSFEMKARSSGTYRFRRDLDGSQIEAWWADVSLCHNGKVIALRKGLDCRLIESTALIDIKNGDSLSGSFSSMEKIHRGRGFYSLGFTSPKDPSKFRWKWKSDTKPAGSLDVFYCSEDLDATDVVEDCLISVGKSYSGIIYVLRWKY